MNSFSFALGPQPKILGLRPSKTPADRKRNYNGIEKPQKPIKETKTLPKTDTILLFRKK